MCLKQHLECDLLAVLSNSMTKEITILVELESIQTHIYPGATYEENKPATRTAY